MPPIVLPKVIFVLGGPGAGKGTQCERINEKYGYVHLSAGDLLREERQRQGSEFGSEIEAHIRDGTIVPVEITCGLLARAMEQSGKSAFLIDGFPRNKDNLDGWHRAMEGKAEVLFVLFFNCPDEVCIQRCLLRGKEGSGRSDDNYESLKKRITTYRESTMPIVDYYKVHNLLKSVDAASSADVVFEEVEKIFNAI